MAMIKCPECGKDISDKAKSCPNCGYPIGEILKCPECGQIIMKNEKCCSNCGYPIEELSSSGTIKIKLSFPPGKRRIGDQEARVLDQNSDVLWVGHVGETAEIHLDKPTEITIKYSSNAFIWGGSCSKMIDPSRSKNYIVTAYSGFASTKLGVKMADMIDAD